MPVANLLRKHFPRAFIAWLVNDSLVGLLKNCPAIHAIIPFHRRRWTSPARMPEFCQYLRKLRRQHFDMTIDLQGLLRSGVVTKATGAARRIGLSDAREGSHWFYNEVVPVPRDVTHAVDRYLLAVKHLGLPVAPVEFPFGESDGDKRGVDEFLRSHSADNSPLIGLCPGARWDNKRWPAESFARLASELSARGSGHRVVLIGGGVEAGLLQSIASGSVAHPIVMAGALPLNRLIELIRRCRLFVGNDTGPTHIAAALRVPTIELFGPTDPALTGPHASQGGHTIVLGKTIECAPCLKPSCANRNPLECLKSIRVEEVIAAAEKWMPR